MASENTPTILLGTASKTINPPVGMLMVGYGNGRANTGVALDLFARAAVLGSSQTQKPSAAIVVLDTLGVAPEFVKRVRQGAAEKIPGLDPATIMVAATHTHSGPTLSPRQFGNDDPAKINAYVDQTVKTAVETLAAAWQEKGEVRAKIGRTEVRIGHNRRVVDPQGVASNVWPDLEGLHSGFFNPNVRILMFEDAHTGKPRAVFSFYACHPVVLGPQNLKISADYPGYFVRAVEAALPGCMAVHITGGAANINPRDAINKDAEKAKPAGDELAKAVLEEIAYLRPINPTPILARTETLTLPLAPDSKQNYSRRAQDSTDGQNVTSEVQAIRLGDIAIVSSPGELFGEIGLAIENTSPFGTTFVAGYANDNLGYLCTETSTREGGYEPRNQISLETERRLLKTTREALVAAKRADERG